MRPEPKPTQCWLVWVMRPGPTVTMCAELTDAVIEALRGRFRLRVTYGS